MMQLSPSEKLPNDNYNDLTCGGNVYFRITDEVFNAVSIEVLPKLLPGVIFHVQVTMSRMTLQQGTFTSLILL